MAYLTPDTNRRRMVALGAVGAVHGALALALLTAFAGGIIQIKDKDWTKAWNYVPPKPQVTPQPAPTQHPRDAQTRPETTPVRESFIDTGNVLDPLPPGPIDLGARIDPLPPLPPTPPSPSFTPRAAKPLGSPGRWVSEADYPSGALHRGQQGASAFELTVGPDGRVRDCRITRSSGSADLDAATCAKVSARASFTPARDAHGDLVAGTFSGVIRWTIPE